MSGICSAHISHDPDCKLCTRIPLSDAEKEWCKGFDYALASQKHHGWYAQENCVLDGFEALETAARAQPGKSPELTEALAALDHMRTLFRGFAPPKDVRYAPEAEGSTHD